MLQEITDEEARRVLAVSREMHWAFPSSQGTPIAKGQTSSKWVDQAVKERESNVNAAHFLLKNGYEEAAIEIASNVWRLWIVARDLSGGRAFLAAVLDARDKKTGSRSTGFVGS